ncbi:MULTISPECIES: hypothetical protein [unclassified Nocardia]|uniref:hypothetical protein n=1 Tax=unclassified Nocardia TaxID=2637762 RepID=UPI0024A7A51B|nr:MULTISPECIES: hypothetical protein [unclassified Nocardia]
MATDHVSSVLARAPHISRPRLLKAGRSEVHKRDDGVMKPLSASSAVVDVIPAVTLGVLPHTSVVFAALPALAPESARLDPGTDQFLLAAARLDGSGRFRAQALLRALGWPPSTRLELRQTATTVTIHADPAGSAMVTARGLLALPVATRRWLGVEAAALVVVIALPAPGLMILAAPDRLVAALLQCSGAGHVC